jgi:ribosome-binding protein aMBF1 (putative translation factor)
VFISTQRLLARKQDNQLLRLVKRILKKSPSADRRGPKGQHIPSTTELGGAIRAARLKKELTTVELGEVVGVSDTSVTQTEAGQTLPRKPTVKSYELALGVA